MKKNVALQIYGFVGFGVVVLVWGYLWYFMRWHILIAYITSINGVTILLYLWDKLIAASHIVRVPEVLLQTCALLGGSPAALLGQKALRHKTQKKEFHIVFWLIVLVQITSIVVWITWR